MNNSLQFGGSPFSNNNSEIMCRICHEVIKILGNWSIATKDLKNTNSKWQFYFLWDSTREKAKKNFSLSANAQEQWQWLIGRV